MVVRQVWTGPGVNIYGAVSPDGRYLSFADQQTGDLVIRQVATGTMRRLTHEGSLGKSKNPQYVIVSIWAPDGKQVAYQWNNESGPNDLRIIGLNDVEPRILYQDKDVWWVQPYNWSSDGQQILTRLRAREDKTEQIALISPQDGSVRLLKTLPYRQMWYMSLSPDGRYIAYDLPEDVPDHDIFLLPTDGSEEIPLVEHPAHDYVLGWTPDGKYVLFVSDRTGTLDAWAIEVGDGKPQGDPRLIKVDVGSISPLGFGREGAFYYGYARMITSDVYVAKVDLETGEVLVPPTKAVRRFEGSNGAPDYSPDGQYLAYVSSRGHLGRSPTILCIRSLDTGEEREWPSRLSRIDSPRWSPDGRFVLVWGRDLENRAGMYRIDVQRGDVTPVIVDLYGQVTILPGSWFPDGESICYTRGDRKSRLCQILVRDLETDTEKELFRAPSWAERFGVVSVSPDGQWLCLIDSKGFLKLVPAAGGEPRDLHMWEQEGQIHTPMWSPDGKHILFVREWPGQADTKTQLWRIRAEGGEPQKLGLEMFLFHSLSVHPDGQRIAFFSYGSEMKDPEVWVMENFLPQD